MKKQMIQLSDKIYTKESVINGAGRGVFALKDIQAGELIESCPVIEIPKHSDKLMLRFTAMRNYYYQWGKNRKGAAIALGFGSIYNHSYTPNASYEKFIDEKRINFTALHDIKKDEEITINYNGHATDTAKLWIEEIPEFKTK